MATPRKSITRAQLGAADAVELLVLCKTVASDGRLEPAELVAIRNWLNQHPDLEIPAALHLRQVLASVLADGVITTDEVREVQAAIEAVVPPDIRKDLLGARRSVEKADKDARRSVAELDTMVAGVYFGGRQAAAVCCRDGQLLRIARQPDNPHDKNAMAVLREDGAHIGYVPREDAAWLASKLPTGARYVASVKKVLSTHRGAVPVIKAVFYPPETAQEGTRSLERFPWTPPASTGLRISPWIWAGIASAVIVAILLAL